MPAKRRYTYEELVAEMPETNQPCELWDGELIMSPAPSFYHQKLCFAFIGSSMIGLLTANWARSWPAIDMVLSPHRVTQPDVAFIAQDRLGIITKTINGPVDLAAEIISLGHRNRDRIEKRDLYEQYGVREYWLIDPEAQTVEVLHLESGRYQLFMRGTPGQVVASKLLPGFETQVAALFRSE